MGLACRIQENEGTYQQVLARGEETQFSQNTREAKREGGGGRVESAVLVRELKQLYDEQQISNRKKFAEERKVLAHRLWRLRQRSQAALRTQKQKLRTQFQINTSSYIEQHAHSILNVWKDQLLLASSKIFEVQGKNLCPLRPEIHVHVLRTVLARLSGDEIVKILVPQAELERAAENLFELFPSLPPVVASEHLASGDCEVQCQTGSFVFSSTKFLTQQIEACCIEIERILKETPYARA